MGNEVDEIMGLNNPLLETEVRVNRSHSESSSTGRGGKKGKDAGPSRGGRRWVPQRANQK